MKDWLKKKLASFLVILPGKEWIAICISIIALIISLIAFWYPYSLSKRLAHLHIEPEIKTRFYLKKGEHNPTFEIGNSGNIPVVSTSVNYQVFILNKGTRNIESASRGEGIWAPGILYSEQLKPSEHPELQLLGIEAPDRLIVYEFNLKYFRESDMREYDRKDYYFIDNNIISNRNQFKISPLYRDVMSNIISFSFESEPNKVIKQPHFQYPESIKIFLPNAIRESSFKIIKSENTIIIPKSGDTVLSPNGEVNKQYQINLAWDNALKAIDKKDYEQAAKAFSENEEMGNKGPEVYSNWCVALKRLAEGKNDAEANKLFDEACEKCKKATEIKSDMYDAYTNWGSALADWAERKEGEDSNRLFNEACEKYKKAIEIKQDDYFTYNNWGIALANWAKIKEGAESEKLFADAFEKYRKAIEIKQDYHEAYNNWGFALADLARRKEGTESDKLFDGVFEKYRKAIEIKSDKYDTYCNWGHALADLAERKEGSERDKLLVEACDKYRISIDIKPDLYEAYCNWSSALNRLARGKEGIESDKLFTDACGKYKKATELKSDIYEIYYTWGNMLLSWAERRKGIESERLLVEACEKYKKTIEIKPDKYEAYNNWAGVLVELAKLKEGEDSDILFNEACDKCKKAIEIKSDFYDAYKNWSITLLEWSYKKEGAEKDKLIDDAILILKKLEGLKRGAGAYTLAYIYGLGDENECQKWLKIGEEEKMLPERQEAMTCPAFVTVRDEQWFKNIHWKGE